jgi:hypothetical protein
MAVTKLSNSGIKTGILKYDSMLAGNAAYDPAATWLIQRVTATGGETSLSFTNIPQTYTSLQIRGIYRDSRTASSGGQLSLVLRFNSDTTDANYAAHTLQGNGATASASGSTSYPYIGTGVSTGPSSQTTTYGVNIGDIHDYTSTTRNKTVRWYSGSNQNTATNSDQVIKMESLLWLSTNAITRIDINCLYVSFAAGTTFALYGFKGA